MFGECLSQKHTTPHELQSVSLQVWNKKHLLCFSDL